MVSRGFIHLGIALLSASALAPAQQTTPAAPAPPPAASPSPTNFPTSGTPDKPLGPNPYETSVSVALLGQVVLQPAALLPEPVPLQYSCPGNSFTEWTDAKGRFSIDLGRQTAAGSTTPGAIPSLHGCHLLLQLPGFEEISINLGKLHRQSDLDLGKIALKSRGAGGALLFSARAAAAPDAARRAYIHALEAASTRDYPLALKEIDKALKAFPSHAPALQLKGQLFERSGHRAAARLAYSQAAQADPNYVKPLLQLAEMAGEDQDPAECARWAAEVNRLAPNSFPHIYFAEAASYFNLDRFADAERVAAAGRAADTTHSFPRLRKVHGESLFRLNRYAEATLAFDEYLQDAPGAPDLDDVATRRAECDRLARILKR